MKQLLFITLIFLLIPQTYATKRKLIPQTYATKRKRTKPLEESNRGIEKYPKDPKKKTRYLFFTPTYPIDKAIDRFIIGVGDQGLVMRANPSFFFSGHEFEDRPKIPDSQNNDWVVKISYHQPLSHHDGRDVEQYSYAHLSTYPTSTTPKLGASFTLQPESEEACVDLRELFPTVTLERWKKLENYRRIAYSNSKKLHIVGNKVHLGIISECKNQPLSVLMMEEMRPLESELDLRNALDVELDVLERLVLAGVVDRDCAVGRNYLMFLKDDEIVRTDFGRSIIVNARNIEGVIRVLMSRFREIIMEDDKERIENIINSVNEGTTLLPELVTQKTFMDALPAIMSGQSITSISQAEIIGLHVNRGPTKEPPLLQKRKRRRKATPTKPGERIERFFKPVRD